MKNKNVKLFGLACVFSSFLFDLIRLISTNFLEVLLILGCCVKLWPLLLPVCRYFKLLFYTHFKHTLINKLISLALF